MGKWKPTERIRGRKLQRIRTEHMKLHPLCVMCEAKGITRLWTQLDHKVPLFKGGADAPHNRQGLCDECHDKKTEQDLGRKEVRQVGADGIPEGW